MNPSSTVLFAAVALVSSLSATALAAATCPAPAFNAAHKRQIPKKKPNQTVFAEAVRQMVNLSRCQNNLPALKAAPRLIKAASLHSKSMAKTKNFSHTSTNPRLRTLKERAKKAEVKYRFLAENIALMARFQFTTGTAFSIVDRANCQFKDPSTGQLIAAHSYASLASQVVTGWMNSPGHRQNILSTKVGKTGAALAFEGSNDTCGQYYMTQVFSN